MLSVDDQFYHIINPWKSKFFYGQMKTNNNLGLSKMLFLGQYTEKKPIELKIMSGTKYGDFMFTAALDLLCVSENVIQAFEQHSISGWKIYDVIITDKKGQSIEGYHVLSFSGRIKCFNTDSVYLDQMPLGPVGAKLDVKKGFKLDLSEWDGSDIFIMENKSYFFVNSKVAEVFKKFGFTNVELERVEDIQVPILKK